MSTRWYPRYVRGNPQLRVFLPDFWMVLKKPETPLPPNKVMFKVPPQMTPFDIRNYLERIYKLPVVNVHTRLVCGRIKQAKSKPFMIKDDDYREAIVDLPKHVNFQYPDVFAESKDNFEDEIEKINKQLDFVKRKEKRRIYTEKRHNVPNWFNV